MGSGMKTVDAFAAELKHLADRVERLEGSGVPPIDVEASEPESHWVTKLILGPRTAKTPMPAPGPGRVWKDLQCAWRAETFGLVRLLSLALGAVNWLSVTVWVVDWPVGYKLRNADGNADQRWVAFWRDCYQLGRTILIIVVLAWGLQNRWWAWWVAVYAVAQIVHGIGGSVLMRKAQSLNRARALVNAVWAYGETILAFGVLYLGCGCIKGVMCSAQAVYFSAVTAATVGYGEMYPTGLGGQRLVVLQIAVSVLFVAVFLAAFLGRLGDED